jgi:hypothetical protein
VYRRSLIAKSHRQSRSRPGQRFFDCGAGLLVVAILPLLVGLPDPRVNSESRTATGHAAAVDPRITARHERIARCLAIYYMRPVDADSLRPWSIMHGFLAYGQDSRITAQGNLVSAVDYLCSNQVGNDRRLLQVVDGNVQANIGIGVQGHPGQFLAMLAQADVPREQVLTVDGQRFTVDDLIEAEQLGCLSGTEHTFRLIGLSHYLASDAVWNNSNGESWSISRLLREELAESINDAACGGSHRLMSISFAIRARRQQEIEFDTLWKAADKYIREYQQFAFSIQNPDGSFSTEWFKERGSARSAKRRLYTTGHILEWLVVSLPAEQLADSRLDRAVDYLTTLMLAAPGYDLDVGPRGHALRALRLYQERTGGYSNYAEFLPEDNLQGRIQPVKIATQPEEGGPRVFNALFNSNSPSRRGIMGWRR